MHKFIDTSNLVTYQSGNNKGHFDWTNNIRKELYFEYDDISGTIKILNYYVERKNGKCSQGKITLQYENNIITTSTSNLVQLKIPTFLNKNKYNRGFKYKIGDIITKGNQTSEIIKCFRKSYNNESIKAYELKCNNCNYKYETREDRLSSCPVCGIRSTYSERFIFSIFIQANINFVVQKEFEWLKNRWYDVYLPDYNIIVEIHGIQHFEPTKLPDRDQKTKEEIFKECIESDKLKKDAALSNGLKYYAIDVSNQDNIYSKAKDTLKFINFSKISEFECGKFAIYNTVKDVCELWNKGYQIDEISEKTGKSFQTVQYRLRQATKYDLCFYDKHINMSNGIYNPNQRED